MMRRRLGGAGEIGELLDLELLERLGTRLDARPKRLEGKTIRQFLVEKLLRVRTREGETQAAGVEPGAAGLRGALRQKKHCAEGAASGHYDVCGGAVFCAHDHPAGNPERAGGAQSGVGGGDLPHRAPLSGELAGAVAGRGLVHFARQRPPGGVSAARQRVPRGDSGGPQRRPRADHPELALFGGRPLARRGGGDAGGVAGGGAGDGRGGAGIDCQRRGGSVLCRMAAGGGERLCAALLPLVVGAELSAGRR